MVGSSNFLQFNPDEINQISDNDYSLNGQRLGGLQGGIAPTALHNKILHQLSIMSFAIGQVLSDQGFNVSDHDPDGLVSALSTVLGGSSTSAFPPKYVTGQPPFYDSPNGVIMPAGLGARTSDNTATLIVPAPITVNLNTVGPNGLDTGVKTANTWYYLYLIGRSSDSAVAGLWSTTNEAQTGSIVLPSGYDQKAQLKMAWRVDNSNNLRYANVASGWPYRPLMMYNDASGSFSNSSPLTVLYSGTATTFTTVSCASLIPPVSRFGYFTMGAINGSTASGTVNIRTTGFTHSGLVFVGTSGNNAGLIQDRYSGLYEVNSSQQLDYIRSGACLAGINVLGYVITNI